jgi:hypothetical protein
MKKCPTCNRTYADDGFTFCLEDGALLSAPFESHGNTPATTIQSAGPPLTAVLPGSADQHSENAPPAPTIEAIAPNSYPRPEPRSQRKFTPLYIALGALLVVLILLLGGSSLYTYHVRQCPRISIRCTPGPGSTYCYLDRESPVAIYRHPIGRAISSLNPVLALQGPIMPQGISKPKWSASDGIVETPGETATVIRTSVPGRVISVTATFETDSWVCPNKATTIFVVPMK